MISTPGKKNHRSRTGVGEVDCLLCLRGYVWKEGNRLEGCVETLRSMRKIEGGQQVCIECKEPGQHKEECAISMAIRGVEKG